MAKRSTLSWLLTAGRHRLRSAAALGARSGGLAGQIHAVVWRSHRAQHPLPPLPSPEADLTDDARQVLQDLARGIDHVRQP